MSENSLVFYHLVRRQPKEAGGLKPCARNADLHSDRNHVLCGLVSSVSITAVEWWTRPTSPGHRLRSQSFQFMKP